eukprot:scaffold208534_cov30-Tisochrysis_lutea.AAC.3
MTKRRTAARAHCGCRRAFGNIGRADTQKRLEIIERGAITSDRKSAMGVQAKGKLNNHALRTAGSTVSRHVRRVTICPLR